MLPALNTAATGLQQFQQDIDVIGNNIANVNTGGYKTARMDFEDAFSQALGGDPSNQVGTGVSTATVQNNFTGGAIAATGVTSDLAINGNGFFAVEDPNTSAVYYTRAGDFRLDSSGHLVTPGGMELLGYSDTGLSTPGPVTIDANGAPPSTTTPTPVYQSFSVNSSGVIHVTLSDGSQFIRGQVLLQQFMNPNGLVKQGANLYSPTAAAGAVGQPVAPGTAGLGTIQDGALEGSNVDLTTEMSDLITAQRAFEANAKIITTSDEVLQDLVNLKR